MLFKFIALIQVQGLCYDTDHFKHLTILSINILFVLLSFLLMNHICYPFGIYKQLKMAITYIMYWYIHLKVYIWFKEVIQVLCQQF